MSVRILIGDARERLKELPDESVHCVVTSPPYWGLRDYGVDGQIGLEQSPEEFVAELVAVFREVRRVLRSDGTLWLNLGDSYAGSGRGGNPTEETSGLEGGQASQRASMIKRTHGSQKHAGFHEEARQSGAIGRAWVPPPGGLKQKDLIGAPWMVAFALRADGWWLRQDNIWHKPNPMPESVTDRCTKAHEYLFLLTKSARYYYDAEAILTPFSAETKAVSFETMDYGRRDDYRSPGNVNASKGQQAYEDGDKRQRTKAGLLDYAARAEVPTRGGANKRSVWTVATEAFPEAHFATFPPALIEPCVKAATSDRGCCPHCMTGWQRITAEVETGRTQKMPDGMATYAGTHSAIHRDGREKGATDNPVMASETIGWYPGCRCDGLPALPPYPAKPSRAAIEDEGAYKAAMIEWRAACVVITDARRVLCDAAKPLKTVPARVLDPFGGAGTTALVAERHHRHAILIELNPEYAAMAERRINAEGGIFADVKIEPQSQAQSESSEVASA